MIDSAKHILMRNQNGKVAWIEYPFSQGFLSRNFGQWVPVSPKDVSITSQDGFDNKRITGND